MVSEHVAEDVARPHSGHIGADRGEHARDRRVRDQPLPEAVVLVDVVLEVVVDDRPVVTPRIAAEQLVAARSGEHDLDELRCELGGVEVRIALADARLLEMPHEPPHHALHVARLEHHLVVLGLEQVREVLGPFALVERELEARRRAQVESDGEGVQPLDLGRRERGDRARVGSAAEVGPDRHVGDELAVDGLAEQAIELLEVLLLGRRVGGLAEAEVPVALGGSPTRSPTSITVPAGSSETPRNRVLS